MKCRKNFIEGESVKLTNSTEGWVIGGGVTIPLPSNSVGSIVAVYRDKNKPECYEVEFYISAENIYVLATVMPSFLEKV